MDDGFRRNMATTQTEVLKKLKESGIIPSSKSLSNEQSSVLQKLEAFGVIEKVNLTYRPCARFYKYADKLIAQEIPVEQFNFDDQPSANQIFHNTIHTHSIGQLNQGSGNFSFEQINVDIIKKSMKNELTPEQLDDIMKALEEKGQNGVVQKLKSFGSDVLANVIAGIITNPALYS